MPATKALLSSTDREFMPEAGKRTEDAQDAQKAEHGDRDSVQGTVLTGLSGSLARVPMTRENPRASQSDSRARVPLTSSSCYPITKDFWKQSETPFSDMKIKVENPTHHQKGNTSENNLLDISTREFKRGCSGLQEGGR